MSPAEKNPGNIEILRPPRAYLLSNEKLRKMNFGTWYTTNQIYYSTNLSTNDISQERYHKRISLDGLSRHRG